MTEEQMDEYVKERNEALRALDPRKMLEITLKYNLMQPTLYQFVLDSMHQARVWCTTFSDEEKQVSIDYLKKEFGDRYDFTL